MLSNLIHVFNIKIQEVNSFAIATHYQGPISGFLLYIWWKYNSGESDLRAYLIWRKFSGFPYFWEFFLSAITSDYCHLSTQCYYGSHIQMHFQFYSYFGATDSYQSSDR